MSTLHAVSTTREAVDAFIAGWNAHDPKAVRAVFTADGRVTDPAIGNWISGTAALEASVQHVLERYRDVAFTLVSVTENGADRVAFEWRMEAALVTPDGRRVPVALEGCDVCRVRDGKIAELRGYFDRAAIMEQLKAAGAA
jgi:ketosteroid isomerase-like protein